jgi:hypothetical protein
VAELEKSLEATGELLRESEVARERAEAKWRSRARALEEVSFAPIVGLFCPCSRSLLPLQ